MRLTNTLNLPQPFVDAATGNHVRTTNRYSATEMLKGTREIVLARRHSDEITEDVAERVWAIFGSAVHSILEQSQESDTQLKECKLVQEFPNGYSVSGIFDLYDDATGTVTDYKTASVWKVKFGSTDNWIPKEGAFDDWRRQLLIYVWLLRQAGFDAHRGEIVALLKDHSKAKARIGEHPPYPVYRIAWDYSDAEIDGMGIWLDEKLREIETANDLPDELIRECTPEERWSKGEAFAVSKKGAKRANKLFRVDDYPSAEAAFNQAVLYSDALGGRYVVTHRPGEDSKCLGYCAAREFCGRYQAIMAGEEER